VVVRRFDGRTHLSTLRCELNRVRQQIPDHLLEPAGVSGDSPLARSGIERHLHLPRIGRRADRVKCLLRHDDQIDGLSRHVNGSLEDSRRIQKLRRADGVRSCCEVFRTVAKDSSRSSIRIHARAQYTRD
jgi:hypothetical protein